MTTPDQPPQPADQQPSDLDVLLAEVVEHAGAALHEQGDFWPFALALTTDDQLVEPAIEPSSARPSVEEVLGLLRGALRTHREAFRATAVCADVTATIDGEVGSALQVELESPTDEPLLVVVPYSRPDGDRPVFTAATGRRGVRSTWTDAAP